MMIPINLLLLALLMYCNDETQKPQYFLCQNVLSIKVSSKLSEHFISVHAKKGSKQDILGEGV